jgi:hypothetical protein
MATHMENNADGTITVSVTFKPGASMLESEVNLQGALNEAGARATGECLVRFDLDGAKMTVAGRGMTSKGRMPKIYQTPYGETSVKRHVYQGSKGGAVFCPMEHAARTMRTATPLFAKQVSFKYANANAGTVVMDFAQHGRAIARSYVGEVASDVASVAGEKEESWSYAVTVAPAGERVATVGIGVDGTCTLFSEEGWRQVMVGTIAFYDGKGERLATTYVADAPEYGKATFFARMDAEIAYVREAYPDAAYVGVADGAHDLWAWLEGRCDWQVVDFWHASEYLAAAAAGMRRGASAQTAWLEDACHRLKHEKGAAAALLAEFQQAREQLGDRARGAAALGKAISYFGNHLERMNYDVYAAMNMPIGSGVTEAACKCIAKERLCGSGMRWSMGGAAGVLSLRTLVKSSNRWEEFWKKTARLGFSRICAPKRPCRA